MLKNWWGAEAPPSDSLISCDEETLLIRPLSRRDPPDEELVSNIRKAWDLTHASEELSAASDFLLACSRNYLVHCLAIDLNDRLSTLFTDV